MGGKFGENINFAVNYVPSNNADEYFCRILDSYMKQSPT